MAVRTYRVGFARIELEGVFGQDLQGGLLPTALRASWRPGFQVTRYGRTWRLTQLDLADDATATAEIGYVREGAATAPHFDPHTNRFVRTSVPSGVVVPLAISLTSGLMAFQLVPGDVRVRSVTGTVRDALNEAQSTYRWTIRELVERRPYTDWMRSVDRVTQFRFKLRHPNPHWPEEGLAQALLDSLRLEVATLVGKGENIDTHERAFQNLLRHVSEQYGQGTLVGETRSGEPTLWKSVEGGIVPAVRRVPSEGEDQILVEDLVQELEAQQTANMEVVGDDDEPDTLDDAL